jgi:hypothetical protein
MSPDFVAFDDPSHMPSASLECIPGPNNMPPARCETTAMIRFAAAPYSTTNVPVLYVFDPDAVACAGNAWTNLMSIVGEGWACLAGRAEDSIGNIGVSKAIRVCFDDGDGTPLCDPNAPETAPSCAKDDCVSAEVPRNITPFSK